MNETKHTPTPGPWYTGEDTVSLANRAFIGIGNGASHVGYASITSACRMEEAQANARLIAAAPELLEELQALVKCFWEGRPKKDVKRDYHLMVQVEAARKAIAKAGGAA